MAAGLAGRSFIGTFSLVFLAIGALWVADTFLAKTEQTESLAEAARLFDRGRELLQNGKSAEAIGPIKDALVIEPANRNYLRTLAEAQFAVGNTSDAEGTIREELQNDSTDGLANLILARVLMKENHFDEAVSYFHRAINGHWDEDQQQKRLRARFELIDLLAARNSKEALLAELLPLQDDAASDLRTRTRMGQLFLQAGSPGRADNVFHSILHDAPGNRDAHVGLGEAEFAQGNYRAAQRDFETALRLAPDDQATRNRLDLCNELLTLDPMARGLGASERFGRSRKLVELTYNEATQCVQNDSPELQGLLDRAGNALKANVGTARESDAAESDVDLAEQLWQARKRDCKTPPNNDSPLALVLAKLAQ